MKEQTSAAASPLSRLMLFGALSRTPHGVFELAAPGLAAMLWLGEIPPLDFIVLGLITAFAGYTSVYALNDLVDVKVDRERIRQGGFQDTEIAVEKMVRHPVAQGMLSFRSGLIWAVMWGLIALVGAWLLNPVCALIFILGAGLEAVYCLMLKISHLRTVVHGVVKASGAMAAVFAATPDPAPEFLAALFFWLFFWEIGGQNVPADWHDLQEDQVLNARTIPLLYGRRVASAVIVGCLAVSMVVGLVLFAVSPARPSAWAFLALLGLGIYFLIVPALMLARAKTRAEAGALFTRATMYPPSVFVVVLSTVLI